MNGDLTYNSNSLSTFDPITRVGINTNVIKHTNTPNAVGDVVNLANISDSAVPTNEYPNRTIILGGTIHGSSQADLDSRIDEFKGIFVQRNKNLDIAYAGGVRRYTVIKANSVGVERQNRALFAVFAVELICKPFGRETTSTILLNAVDNTSGAVTIEPTITGTAPYQLPIIIITIDALTGSGDFIQVGNDLNGQELIVAGEGLVAGDVLVINAETRKVTVNDEPADYDGTFLELEAGDNSLTVTDGFTTRTKDILIEYYRRFM